MKWGYEAIGYEAFDYEEFHGTQAEQDFIRGEFCAYLRWKAKLEELQDAIGELRYEKKGICSVLDQSDVFTIDIVKQLTFKIVYCEYIEVVKRSFTRPHTHKSVAQILARCIKQHLRITTTLIMCDDIQKIFEDAALEAIQYEK